MLDDYFRQYGLVAVLAVVAFVVPTSMLAISWLFSLVGIRPNKPNPVKNDVYECGMQTIGGRWTQFNFRYYMYALLFVVFDVAVIFVYPWAARFTKLPGSALIAMLGFLFLLMVAWIYALKKQDLDWR